MEAAVHEREFLFLVSNCSSYACSGLRDLIWIECTVDESTPVCAELHAVM